MSIAGVYIDELGGADDELQDTACEEVDLNKYEIAVVVIILSISVLLAVY